MTIARDREHGTYTGAQQHSYRDEELCDDCRVARNAYMREWRKRNGNRQSRRNAGVRSKMLYVLRRDHPAFYEELHETASLEWDAAHPEETR